MSLEVGGITVDCRNPATLRDFWQAALGYEVESDYGDFVFLRDPAGRGPRIGIQRVPEAKGAKNRQHLDLHAGDREEEVQRLLTLGARELARHRAGDVEWVVIADPEGNEFCVSG
jgi:catechol 2,3-dioxygenase-like lactoylglutathione lyase family enzyme